MDACSSCLLSCGLRPRQKEHDFTFVHFNLDTQKIPVGVLYFMSHISFTIKFYRRGGVSPPANHNYTTIFNRDGISAKVRARPSPTKRDGKISQNKAAFDFLRDAYSRYARREKSKTTQLCGILPSVSIMRCYLIYPPPQQSFFPHLPDCGCRQRL